MKINELIGVKSITKPRQHLHQIVSFLINRGFTVAGSGAFSDVLIPPNKGYVLKLFLVLDYPYLDFLRHVVSSSNPHFPRFRGRPIAVTDKVMGIRMEPLEPMSWRSADLVQSYCKYHALENPPTPPDELPNDMKKLVTRFPQLDEAISLMKSWIKPNTRWDLHGQNIMKRGDVPVFTDPWAYNISGSLRNPGPGLPPARLSE